MNRRLYLEHRHDQNQTNHHSPTQQSYNRFQSHHHNPAHTRHPYDPNQSFQLPFTNQSQFDGDELSLPLNQNDQIMKLRSMQSQQANNLDKINHKIKRLLSTLYQQDPSPSDSAVIVFHPRQEASKYEERQKNKSPCFGPVKGSQISDKYKNNQIYPTKLQVANKMVESPYQQELELIRQKYQGKNRINSKHTRTVSQIQTKIGQSVNSQNPSIDLIRFKKKIKDSTKEQNQNKLLQMRGKQFHETCYQQKSLNRIRSQHNFKGSMNKEKQNEEVDKNLKGQRLFDPLKDHDLNAYRYQNEQFDLNRRDFEWHFEMGRSKQPMRQDKKMSFFYNEQHKSQVKIDISLFLQSIVKQIELDQQFRNGKKWFNRLPSTYKWLDLSKCLKQNSVKLDDGSIKQIFFLQMEEDDPFCTPREESLSVHQLVMAFIACEEHWFMNIVKQYPRQMMINSSFVEDNLDLGSKGHIQIQDLVSYLNIELDKQFRNRDLFLVYQRLKQDDSLLYSKILDVICI